MRLAFLQLEADSDCAAERGTVNRALAALAERAQAAGLRLAGTVQTNIETTDPAHCDMDLTVLPQGPMLRISQNLGAGSRGCRLDADALERAVGLTETRLAGADLLIVNKFGKQEALGRGFREVIAQALAEDIPVVLGLNALNREAFLEFCGGEAEELASAEALGDWFEALHA